ncbi:MAG: succinate dehydrogenase assembly factor 2 [Gallionellales bacterium CG_4_8_14_3_um_filter_54_18]|nr:MAG: succinate dehydrogenase assembly factor 2 [Gallionellales bacterium CG_4_8_14_3_um_filter_54_18]PJC04041.1 MAG: succinate dehydrogenase assembly factor 2 [Gallionellales bacterium CG_4_9_14_0_8_um_filter_55_61]
MTNEDRGLRIEDKVQQVGSGEVGLLSPQSSALNPAVLQRLRWRCRRGLLELDIVLGRFVDAHYAQLSEPERKIFDDFLDMADNPLWDMISGRKEAVSDEQVALLETIRRV